MPFRVPCGQLTIKDEAHKESAKNEKQNAHKENSALIKRVAMPQYVTFLQIKTFPLDPNITFGHSLLGASLFFMIPKI
jgi:hypothetical protein